MKEKEKITGKLFEGMTANSEGVGKDYLGTLKALSGMMDQLKDSMKSDSQSSVPREGLDDMMDLIRRRVMGDPAFSAYMCVKALKTLHDEVTGDMPRSASICSMLTEDERRALNTTANAITYNYNFGPFGGVLMHIRLNRLEKHTGGFTVEGIGCVPDELHAAMACACNAVNTRTRTGRWNVDPATGVLCLEITLTMTGLESTDKDNLKRQELNGRNWFLKYLPHIIKEAHAADRLHGLWRISYVDLGDPVDISDLDPLQMLSCKDISERQAKWHNLYDDTDISPEDHSCINFDDKEDKKDE